MKYSKISKLVGASVLLLASIATKAQGTTSEPEMADLMRSNGKIYVVVAVLAVIFIGIVVYLISLDRKVKKLEKLVRDK